MLCQHGLECVLARCVAKAGGLQAMCAGMWVALRGSGLQIVALAMRHNNKIYAPYPIKNAFSKHLIYSICQ